MSAKDHLSGVYRRRPATEVRDYYDEWSDSYETELSGQGYVTPRRCAEGLRATGTPLDARILDFGCGTGLSGQALRAAGFLHLSGCDLSAAMLDRARDKGVYDSLQVIAPDAAPPAGFDVIAAVGVISPGAAPPETLDALIAALPRGGRLVMSYNDHALADPDYTGALQRHLDAGARLLLQEHGDHIPGIGLKSTVYVIEI